MYELTLTFDNGPTPWVTAVLDVPASYDIRETSCVLGERLGGAAGRRVVGRAHEEGAWSAKLHDTDMGAMRNLPRFVEAAGEAGGRFRRQFPPDCVPILRGEITGPIDRYVALERGKERIQ